MNRIMLGRLAAVVVGVLGLALGVGGDQPAPVKTAELGGDERYLTFVSTDKPIYLPGETLYVRAVALHADRHTPMLRAAVMQVEVTGPRGDVVAMGTAGAQESVGAFAWTIPATMAGGQYTVKVSHPYTGQVPGVRTFDIRAFRAPRLKSQIVFVREGYGPGETVAASVHVDRAEGGIPAGAKVEVIARVDGSQVYQGQTVLDDKGNASTAFALPATIARGQGTLAWVIQDGGVSETASKTIPILLQTVDLTLYPEGGDLVAGVSNRVYLEAFTPAKKPADLAGSVVDDKGSAVASFTTTHEGRGKFAFTPQAGKAYALKIEKPAGIKTVYPLPAARESGVVLGWAGLAGGIAKSVKVTICTPSTGTYLVTLSKREKELARRTVTMHPRQAAIGASAGVGFVHTAHEVEFEVAPEHDGVLTATVWDEKGSPLAERLVYRAPAESITIDIKPDKSQYVPGDLAKLTVTTTNARGKPIGAMVGLTVSDDAVLEMIDKREQAPRLPVMVLLEQEVLDLADAQVYLDAADPRAPEALDLLLGTQGWRRFATVKTAAFLARHGDAGRRVLAMRAVTQVELTQSNAMDLRPMDPRIPQMARPMKAPVEQVAPPMAGAEPPVAGPVPPVAPVVEAGDLREDKKRDEARPEDKAQRPVAEARLVAELEKAQKERAANQPIIAAGKAMAEPPAVRQDFVVVREFAHALRPGRQAGDRTDFAQTLYWNAGVRTDQKTGQATVSFALSDAVTSFRVLADAFDSQGTIGAAGAMMQSVQPFYAEIKLPLEITQGDRVKLPLTLVNAAGQRLEGATFTPPQIKSATDWSLVNQPVTISPQERMRRTIEFTAGDATGEFDVAIEARAGAFKDKVTRKLKIKPRGFPQEFARGGMLGPAGEVTYEIEIPAEVVGHSVTSELAIYPTPLGNLTQALEALIQSPSGCFEQTSSTTYPLVMAQQYFTSHQGVDPKVIERSRGLLEDGYKRLLGFECRTTRGYEWFGADPGHDALSAYGLLEFTDMALVREVDPAMLGRTREFVLKSRDGSGGYKRLTHTLHTWVPEPECNNGYITWALLECGVAAGELTKEIDWIKQNIGRSKNSYAIALGANILMMAGDAPAAQAGRAMMDTLAGRQAADGMVGGATQSVIGSGGEALAIETTALATLAWLRDANYAANVEKAMMWLSAMCKGGRFGSTQSTILSLRAIVTYDKLRARPKAPGTVQVMVDGKAMGPAVAFDDKTQGAIKLQDVSEMLSPGKHTITLKMERGAAMPFSVAARYNTLRPVSSEQCKLSLKTVLRDAKVIEGGITEAVATVVNKTNQTIPTPIAIVGIPGGLEVRHDQLKELVKAGKIAAYEVIGREVVLYWRALKADEEVDVPLSLVAAIPGTYSGPASRAYLYYTDEHKQWAAPLTVEITPR